MEKRKNKKFIGLKPEVFFKPQIWKNHHKGRGIKPNLSNKINWLQWVAWIVGVSALIVIGYGILRALI